MSKVYGYAVVDTQGNQAPLKRKVYDTRNSAATGFYQATKRFWDDGEWLDYPEIKKGAKLAEQSTFKVVGLGAVITYE